MTVLARSAPIDDSISCGDARCRRCAGSRRPASCRCSRTGSRASPRRRRRGAGAAAAHGDRTRGSCAGRCPSPSAADVTWYSSSPSWRLSSCDEMTTGAAESSSVTSNVIIARWRCTRLTRRVERTCTRLPAGVRHSSSRVSTPDAEVEHALVVLEVGGVQQQRLVVDEQLHQLRVGHVDDGLAGLGEAERLLGVMDRPGLVEAVQERAVAVRLAALLGVGAHAEVAVADGEQRLGEAQVAAVELALDQPPRVDRVPVLGKARVVRLVASRRAPGVSARSVDDDVGTVGEQRVGAGAAVDAEHEREAAGASGGHAGERVLHHGGRDGRDAAGRRPRSMYMSGCRLAGQAACGGDVAVDHHVEPVRQAGGAQHLGGVARRRHHGDVDAGGRRADRARPPSRDRRRCRRARASRRTVGSCGCRARTRWCRRAHRRRRRRAARCRAMRGTNARRRSAACRRRSAGSRRRRTVVGGSVRRGEELVEHRLPRALVHLGGRA